MGNNTDGQPALSKRKRRALGSNPSNTWQQQPRIKSPAARTRAYLSFAGLANVESRPCDVPETDASGVEPSGTSASQPDGVEKSKQKAKINKVTSGSILDPTLDLHSEEVRFGRLLGGTDQRDRHRAVTSLANYLKARTNIENKNGGLSELDFLKLWKGLWYTLYMADKVPVQDKLSEIFAQLMWCLAGTEEDDEYAGQLYLQMEERDNNINVEECESDGVGECLTKNEEEENDERTNEFHDEISEKHCGGAHLVSLYFGTFLRTVRREWGNVDKHRIDKFYTAVRFMLAETYKYMAKRHWNLGIVRLFNDVLFEEALSKMPNGLRYHLIDICVDELAKVNKTASLSLTEATFLDCLEPFFALAQKAGDRNVHNRVMENVLRKFLHQYSFVSDSAFDKCEESLIFDQVHVETVAKFIFEIASDSDTDERFRKALYDMYKDYVKKIRAAGRDVDLEDTEENISDDEDEDDFCPESITEKLGDEKFKEEQAMMDTESVQELVEQSDRSATPAPEIPSKKKKKKKTKKKLCQEKKRKLIEEEKPDSQMCKATDKQMAEDKVADETKPPDEKHVRNACKIHDEINNLDSTSDVTTGLSTPAPKMKRQKQTSPPSVDPRAMIDSDGVDKPAINNDDGSSCGDFQLSDSASKRVSFCKTNRCKSYKASMKALKTLDHQAWSTANRAPDKSILHGKHLQEKLSVRTSGKPLRKKKRKGT